MFMVEILQHTAQERYRVTLLSRIYVQSLSINPPFSINLVLQGLSHRYDITVCRLPHLWSYPQPILSIPLTWEDRMRGLFVDSKHRYRLPLLSDTKDEHQRELVKMLQLHRIDKDNAILLDPFSTK
jgi:glycerol-3-phosphate O-acyltransferase